ncbi:MAG: hypothetical protein K8R87_08530 [Verrucomicrobia bacterium]|nr:hypothetical protein [Verrucomicrobiota bacterium]
MVRSLLVLAPKGLECHASKMKMRCVPLLAAWFAIGITAPSQLQARLGETPAECTARYGKPAQLDKEKMTLKFVKDGIQLPCHFYEGKCDQIIFARADEKIERFTNAEIAVFLEANGGGEKWEKSYREVGINGIEQAWETLSGIKAFALKRGLGIRTKGFYERQKAATKKAKEEEERAKADAAKAKLKDF